MCPITIPDPVAEWTEAIEHLNETVGEGKFCSLDVVDWIEQRRNGLP